MRYICVCMAATGLFICKPSDRSLDSWFSVYLPWTFIETMSQFNISFLWKTYLEARRIFSAITKHPPTLFRCLQSCPGYAILGAPLNTCNAILVASGIQNFSRPRNSDLLMENGICLDLTFPARNHQVVQCSLVSSDFSVLFATSWFSRWWSFPHMLSPKRALTNLGVLWHTRGAILVWRGDPTWRGKTSGYALGLFF